MFKIKEELLQKILNYLATRPYIEVERIIAALQQVEKIVEKKAEEKK